MATRYFALVAGLAYLLAGLLGFFPGVVQQPGPGDPDASVVGGYGLLLGLFPVNFLHNLVHLGLGAWGVMAYRDHMAARSFARGLAWIYGLLTLMGLIPGLNTMFGLAPLFGHDIWLHAVTALVAAYFGYSAPPVEREPVGVTGGETPPGRPRASEPATPEADGRPRE